MFLIIKKDEFIAFENSFWELTQKMEQVWFHIFSQTFPGSQSKIVYLLLKNGSLKMSDIANQLELTAGAVTTASTHLINHGYVERVPSDQDRRVIHLQLTENGKNTLVELQEEGNLKMRHIFQHVDKKQLKSMEHIFSTAIEHLHTLEDR